MKRLFEHRWGGRLILLLAGGLGPFGFAPYEQWWLLLLSLLVFLLAWQWRPASRLLDAYLFGFAYFLHGLSWLTVSIHDYGGGALWFAWSAVCLAALILATAFALAAKAPEWLIRAFNRALNGFAEKYLPAERSVSDERLSLWWPVLSLVAFEWLRGHVFSGFPWLTLGYAFVDSPLSGYLPVFGVFSLSLLALASVLFLVKALLEGVHVRSVLCLLLASLPWFSGSMLAQVEWTQPTGKPLNVAVLQGNHGQEMKWLEHQRDRIIRDYLTMTEAAMGADLVVWPETAVTGYFDWVYPERFAAIEKKAKQAGTTIMLGAITRERSGGDYYNAIVSLGASVGEYRKRHLVPFGEYFPLRPIVEPILKSVNIPMSSFSPGEAQEASLRANGQLLLPMICYEAIFAGEVAASVGDAAYLLNVSNDGWFGRSAAAYQHLQMARTRVLELQRPMIRATNTGISAIIDASGREIARLPLFQSGVLRAELYGRGGSTPYQRFADAPLLILLLLGVSTLVACQRRSNQVR